MNDILKTFSVVLFAVLLGTIASLGGSIVIDKSRELNHLIHLNSPVVKDMEIVDSIQDGKSLLIRIVGKKVRQCGPPYSMIVRIGEKREIKGRLVFMDDVHFGDEELSPDAQELGFVDFGWWKIEPHPNGRTLHIESIHNCDGVLVPTVNGVWLKEHYTKEKQ